MLFIFDLVFSDINSKDNLLTGFHSQFKYIFERQVEHLIFAVPAVLLIIIFSFSIKRSKQSDKDCGLPFGKIFRWLFLDNSIVQDASHQFVHFKCKIVWERRWHSESSHPKCLKCLKKSFLTLINHQIMVYCPIYSSKLASLFSSGKFSFELWNSMLHLFSLQYYPILAALHLQNCFSRLLICLYVTCLIVYIVMKEAFYMNHSRLPENLQSVRLMCFCSFNTNVKF